ncbi:hypothetical protein B0H19DRAFT_1266651 [Mycena capillaripes]|nr:hypothetical protein B0H19DRAFT_1266651 [Mycena capillaripes]
MMRYVPKAFFPDVSRQRLVQICTHPPSRRFPPPSSTSWHLVYASTRMRVFLPVSPSSFPTLWPARCAAIPPRFLRCPGFPPLRDAPQHPVHALSGTEGLSHVSFHRFRPSRPPDAPQYVPASRPLIPPLPSASQDTSDAVNGMAAFLTSPPAVFGPLAPRCAAIPPRFPPPDTTARSGRNTLYMA